MADRVAKEAEWLTNIVQTKLVENELFLRDYNETSAATFKIHDITIKMIGADEAFMLTVCYRATVIFEYMGSVEQRLLVVKKTPEVPQEMYDDINFEALFNNEIQTYTKIIPTFAEIMDQKFTSATFYYGEAGKNFAYVILEDFATHGWGVAKAMTNFSLEHVMLTVKYLAKFHACGFAMRDTQRERFDWLNSLLKESRYAKSTVIDDYEMLLAESGNRLVAVTQQYYPLIPPTFTQRLCNMQKKTLKYNKERVAPVEPMVTLCHGDFLRNNIAYKYADENRDHPVDVMMFDLQTPRIGSPMIDLTTFLGLSVFAEVRYKHFAQIFTAYCDELSAAYRAFSKSEDLPAHLNYDCLIKEYVRLLPYSVSIAVSFLPALVEPYTDVSVQDLITQQRTPEDIKHEAMTRGGAVVDQEVAHQVKELYDLMTKYDVDIFKNCDY